MCFPIFPSYLPFPLFLKDSLCFDLYVLFLFFLLPASFYIFLLLFQFFSRFSSVIAVFYSYTYILSYIFCFSSSPFSCFILVFCCHTLKYSFMSSYGSTGVLIRVLFWVDFSPFIPLFLSSSSSS